MKKHTRRGFTLIELLIVIAIIATIMAIAALVINPVEYFKRGRDSQRLMDYTAINQAVNFYTYGASVLKQDADFDGPNYANTCAGEGDQRLFVSVPDDNGESNPTPPSGWTYNRASSTSLRQIDGAGWLPLDFESISPNLRPLNILPVDPINTFADGFYYTYTCGSYELNLRFETSKYNELASTDGGDDPDVYEIGSTLTEAPSQDSYRPSGSAGGSSNGPGTLVFYPNGAGFYSQWIPSPSSTSDWDTVNEPSSTLVTSDYMYATSSGKIVTFNLEDPASGQTGAITAVRIKMSALNTNVSQSKYINPRIRACDGTDTGNCLSYDAGSAATYTATWTQNPHMSRAWSWDDIKTLQAGGISSGTYTSSQLRMFQLYVEVDHE
jgi:prepilin-type N-terminal cleavage/methylation domain-containing protein